MSFTSDQGLELIPTGTADWDTSFNANMAALEAGLRVKAIAGSSVGSGWVGTLTGSGTVLPLDAQSRDFAPHVMALTNVGSGAEARFLANGVVRSMSIWSGHITPGQPVFVAASSAGLLVSSYAGHGEPCGVALNNNAVRFLPGYPRVFPALVTQVATTPIVLTGAAGDFALAIGQGAIVLDLRVVSEHDRYKVQFWSGSARTSGLLEYETLTRSLSTGSADVSSTSFHDRAMFPHIGSDVGSPHLIHGRVTAQSGSAVSSGYFGITVIAERFK